MDTTVAYLFGALHDGYVYTGKSKGKVAVFTQKERGWLEKIKQMIKPYGKSAWIFKQREIFILETKFGELFHGFDFDSFSEEEKQEFVSGFFDAEGGIPMHPETSDLIYIQFVQKKPDILAKMMKYLEENGISCGKLHMYDKGRSNCWRFFIRTKSLLDCARIIHSRHPSKIRRREQIKTILSSCKTQPKTS